MMPLETTDLMTSTFADPVADVHIQWRLHETDWLDIGDALICVVECGRIFGKQRDDEELSVLLEMAD